MGRSTQSSSMHRLAILVPFRDRFQELMVFVPHMHRFLTKQNIDHHIFILNQADSYRFNRASLINVGFREIGENFDYIAMHDIDLLPLNDNLKYSYPLNGPLHISSPQFHPRYSYPTFIGGILLINKKHYQMVDGMSNNYWGWGLEDDEFYLRIKEAKLPIQRPHNITTGRSNTIRHNHDKNHRKRDMEKCFNQKEVTRKRDRLTGVSDVAYSLRNRVNVTVDNVPVTVMNIFLICDKTRTPWCECDEKNNVENTKKL